MPQQLVGLLVQFEFLSEAWPLAPLPVDRASIGREHSQALDEIVEDKDAPAAARVSAASVLLDRGHGKAAQLVEVSG